MKLRNLVFQALYWTTSIIVVLLAVPLLLLPGRGLLMRWLWFYARMMTFWMRSICGISIEIRDPHHLTSGPCIVAPKHQSWGDGFVMFGQIPDLAIVTGDHLEKIPLVGFILRKMEAVVVDNCGGSTSRSRITDEDLARAQSAKRKILIYPEGHLAPVGYHYRYKKGAFHMYEAYGCPVVPVATNLGLFWPMDDWSLTPGTAVVQFLEPIQPGLDKDTFMALLENRIETASLALLPEGFELPEHRELEYDKDTDSGVPTKPQKMREPV